MPPTLNCDKLVALLMNQQFAIDALIPLSSKSPDSVCADGTVSTLQRVNSRIFDQSVSGGAHL